MIASTAIGNRLLTVPEVARRLRIPPAALRQLCELNEFPHVVLPVDERRGEPREELRFDEADVLAWIEDHKRSRTRGRA